MTYTIFEPARNIEVIGHFDICVVGGSCTGVFAAVRAARLGAKVALVEDNGFFGGVATASLVNVWHSIYDISGKKQIIGGLTQEVIERLLQKNAAIVDRKKPTRYCVYNPAVLKLELDSLVLESGIVPFLHAKFVAAMTDDGKIESIIIEDKSGRRAIKASYFIDATGDGDIVDRLGLDYSLSQKAQPPTTCVVLSGLGRLSERQPDFDLGKVVFGEQDDELPPGYLWHTPMPGEADNTMVAGTRIKDIDCTNADHLTMAEIEGRRQAWKISEILRKHLHIDGNSPLVQLPTRIGVRESRHAKCHYHLSEQDILTGTSFDDAIANGSFPVEIHLSDRPGTIFKSLDGTEIFIDTNGSRTEGRWTEAATKATFYQIPYRSLIPRGIDNLLVAGRSIDADPGAFGAIRVMVNCNQTGEAAGTASVLALNQRLPVHQVDSALLRRELSKGGSIVI